MMKNIRALLITCCLIATIVVFSAYIGTKHYSDFRDAPTSASDQLGVKGSLSSVTLPTPPTKEHGEYPADIRYISRLDSYDFSPTSTIEERAGRIPAWLLNAYRDMDGRPDYEPYILSDSEAQLLVEYLRLLPPIYERIFNERCVGVYFVSRFMGNGMMNWVVDENGKLYFHLVLNPDSLKNNLSVTITERENSCFRPSTGAKVTVNAGTQYKGLAYALFHEATHAVDLIKRISPYTENDPILLRYLPDPLPAATFVGDWAEYSLPKSENNFQNRDKLFFYGLGPGAQINYSEAPELYQGLVASPFPSLYGSKSWAEDLAELATLGMLTQRLDQPYKITLTVPGASPFVFEPQLSSKTATRLKEILKLLDSL